MALPRLRDRDVFTIAAAVGIVGGLAEASATVIRYAVAHRPVSTIVWNEVYWMAPLAAATSLLVLGLVLCGARRLTGVRAIADLAPFVFILIVVYGFGRSQLAGLNALAVLVFAIGVGAAAMRGLRRWEAPVLRWTRRFVAVSIVGLAVWVAWVPQARVLERRQALEHAPPPAGDGPNILLIVWDTVRAASLSLYGYERETTPNLVRFAEDAVVFERAVATSSWTLPSHASLFTGRYPHEHLADREAPLDERFPTLADVLAARGYETAGFIANLYWLGRAFGLNRGFQRWEDEWWSPSLEQVVVSWSATRRLNARIRARLGSSRAAVRIHADRVQSGLLEWLDGRVRDRPFFAFVNLYDAHEPYEPPGGPHFAREGARYWWDYQVPDTLTAPELTDLRDTYDSGIYYLDQQLGRLLQALEDRGLLDNTVIVLTSDHGETLGENHPGVLGHATNLYYDVLNVPLVVRYPPALDPGRRDEVVSHVDIPATVMDLVDAGDAGHPFPGHSLRPVLAGEDGPVPLSAAFSVSNPAEYHLQHDVWPMSRGPLQSIVADGRHYVRDSRGGEDLFDVRHLIWETDDVSGTPEGKSLLPGFRAALEQVLEMSEGAATSGRVPSAGPADGMGRN